jgi:hypothetical protein
MSLTLVKYQDDLLMEVADSVFSLAYDPDIQNDPDYSDGDKLTDNELTELNIFCELLDEIGITTAEQFMDRTYGAYSWERGMSAEAVFTEEYITDLGAEPGESWVVVDYQGTWDANLRHDFDTVEYNHDTYFFLKS